jgi:uncharacterized membrane protein
MDTVRLEAFSDGVLAIAITLLVLEIHVPPAELLTTRGTTLLHALARLWPSYVGFVVSFLTIGIMWANHHAIFRYVRRTDRWFLLINVFFLMCVSFLPFPTAVLAEYLPIAEERRWATVFYGATLVVISLAFGAVWRYGVRDGRLLGDSVDEVGIRTISKRYALGAPLYSVATLVALASVTASLIMHAALALLFALPERPVKSAKT